MKKKIFTIYIFSIIFLTSSLFSNVKPQYHKIKSTSLSTKKTFSKTNNSKPVLFINNNLILNKTSLYIDYYLYISLELICNNLGINYTYNKNIVSFRKNNKKLHFKINKIKNNTKYISYNQLVILLKKYNADYSWNLKSKTLKINHDIYDNNFTKEDAINNVSVIFSNNAQGSSVLIDKYTLLTCWHVIEDFNYDLNNIVVGDANIDVLGLRKVVNNDLAVLDVTVRNKRDYPKLNVAYKWNRVTSIGFPNTSFSITTGQITNVKQFYKYPSDTSYTIENQSDVKINHGSSGGALYNAKYELIGITNAFDKKHSYSLPVK
ncbi:MAG: trypsin-like peptidase domain-containing protein [Clostridiales bacterium]